MRDYKDMINWLEKAKIRYNEIKGIDSHSSEEKLLLDIFPELAENNDERIRKALVEYFKYVRYNGLDLKTTNVDEVLDWLEKQGERVDNTTVPHKFKVGDWVVDEEDNHVYQVRRVVDNVSSGMFGYDLSDGGYFYSTKTNYHLWSIADAKGGDVLTNGKMIVIFKHFVEPSYREHIVAYIGLDYSGHIQVTDGSWKLGIDKAKPATKEQRDTLMKEMSEAGYTFDFEKKELKKIEFNPDDLIDTVTKKSAWSEEDEDVIYALETILDILIDPEAGIGLDEVQGVKNETMKSWLKSIEERVQPQPKQVGWSEEDQNFSDFLEGYLEFDYSLSMNDRANTLDWLKSIKQRLS